MSRKVTFDTEKAIKLLKLGFKQKAIAEELNIPSSTLRMFYKRNTGQELKKIKATKNDGFVLEHSHILSLKAMKEIRDDNI